MPSLSTIAEIQLVPPTSKFIRFCGQVIDMKFSEKKTTALFKCKYGEIVAVTAFSKENEIFCKGCSVVKVIGFTGLKAQPFDNNRFDGKAFFCTPLDFELIFHAYSTLAIMESLLSKEINGFEEVKAGSDLYVLKCILTTPLQLAGPNLYGCEVVDSKGYRADMLIKAKELPADLVGAKKGNLMVMDGTMATISGECMTFQLDSPKKLKFADNKVYKMAEVLKTPVKNKNNDGMGGETPQRNKKENDNDECF